MILLNIVLPTTSNCWLQTHWPFVRTMASSASQNDAGTDYWPIHIARSDGRGYAKLDHNALSPDEDQDVAQQERWEVIVAGHLQNQVAPKDDSM